MERLFVDTSAWFAYVNKSDPDHEKVRRRLGLQRAISLDADFEREGFELLP